MGGREDVLTSATQAPRVCPHFVFSGTHLLKGSWLRFTSFGARGSKATKWEPEKTRIMSC